MTQDNWTGEGYDAKAGSGDGKFLRLKEKGQEVRLRLATNAYRYIDVYTDKDTGKTEQRRKVAWGAIVKEKDADGKMTKRAVVFVNGPQVYGCVQDLTKEEEWGDPMTYDLKITRSEDSPAKYYTVVPLPTQNKDLTPDEKALLKEANLLTVADVQNALGGPEKVQEAAYDPTLDE